MLLDVVKRTVILFLSFFRKADTLRDNQASQMLTKLLPEPVLARSLAVLSECGDQWLPRSFLEIHMS